jgi:heat shock protein HslJ
MRLDPRQVALSVVLAAAMVGCTGSDSSGGELTGATWPVSSLSGSTIPAGLRMEVTFRDDTIEGSDGCNSFGGPYSTTGEDGVDIGGLSSTAIGCEPAIAAAGTAFTSALDRAATYDIDDDVLTLFDDAGAELARFRSGADPPIVGVAWRAFGYRDGPVDEKQAVVSPLDGSIITAEFGADGTMSGSAGCNTYTADYSVEGNGFRITALVSTERACGAPLMAQERAYLDALGSVARWQFSGPAFQLLNETGTVETTYSPP